MSDLLCKSVDSIGAGAPENEIEITPEMIEAGEYILLANLGGAVSSHWDPYELAILVYRAMDSVNPLKRGRDH
jgi:hypothetical protein